MHLYRLVISTLFSLRVFLVLRLRTRLQVSGFVCLRIVSNRSLLPTRQGDTMRDWTQLPPGGEVAKAGYLASAGVPSRPLCWRLGSVSLHLTFGGKVPDRNPIGLLPCVFGSVVEAGWV
ncbi:hypothetical protein EDB80DRAFT_210879 [Ilyonectria destructans]|nr:hypothetical protein EDB80DRAFT_210879 [Ilyonectria destructans]